MITMKSNIDVVSANIIQRLKDISDPKVLLRPVALDVVNLMTERIHEKGQAADGGQIGTYSSAYLKYRLRRHKRSSDPKVIVSLTRQLENDWAVIATPKGWGIGFNNAFNLQKMRWVEEMKKKKIAALASSERTYAVEKLKKLVNEKLNNG